MKNKFILAVCITILLCASAFYNTLDFCYASEVVYYRVIDDNTYLYKTSALDDAQNNAYFKLPNTYFVKVINQIDENTAKVLYDDIEGFVNTSAMQKCYSTPTTPYPQDLTLNILDVCNVVMYQSASQESAYVGVIPFNASNIKYFGSIQGTEAVENMGSVWHYVKYTSFEQGVLYGYVYAPLTNNLSLISANTESIIFEDPDTINASTTPISAEEFKNSDSLFIIVGLLILAVILLYLLFKPNRKQKAKTREVAPIPNKNLNYIAKHTENDEFDF